MAVVLEPTSADIGRAQNEESNLGYQRAARYLYGLGKRARFFGWGLSIMLALAAPVVLLLAPDAGPALGAVAGLWVFVSRGVLEPYRKGRQLRGARAQERFDCAVLGLPWNHALVEAPADEDLHRASLKLRNGDGIRDWYPVPARVEWPTSVLICLRANAVWSRRQHSTFAIVLLLAAAGWCAVGLGVAVVASAELSAYLTTILLPSLPAGLDAVEFSGRHTEVAQRKQELETEVCALLDGNPNAQQLRDLQDQVYLLRVDEPLVPDLFYRLVRDSYEEDMHFAATRVAGKDRS